MEGQPRTTLANKSSREQAVCVSCLTNGILGQSFIFYKSDLQEPGTPTFIVNTGQGSLTPRPPPTVHIIGAEGAWSLATWVDKAALL